MKKFNRFYLDINFLLVYLCLQKSKIMKKLLKILLYPFRLVKIRRMKNKIIDEKFLKKETEFNLILEKLLESNYRKLHCDVKDKNIM